MRSKKRNPQDATVKHYIAPLRRDLKDVLRRVKVLERLLAKKGRA